MGVNHTDTQTRFGQKYQHGNVNKASWPLVSCAPPAAHQPSLHRFITFSLFYSLSVSGPLPPAQGTVQCMLGELERGFVIVITTGVHFPLSVDS